MAHKRILKDYLDDIAFSIEKIEQFTVGLTQAQFTADIKTNFAVIRAFEIIGEAVKHLPEETRAPYPQIPWRAIAGIRDKLIHELFWRQLRGYLGNNTSRSATLKSSHNRFNKHAPGVSKSGTLQNAKIHANQSPTLADT